MLSSFNSETCPPYLQPEQSFPNSISNAAAQTMKHFNPSRLRFLSAIFLWFLCVFVAFPQCVHAFFGADAEDVTTFDYYDASGLLKSRTDALSRVTTFTYDQRGRLMTEVSHNGGTNDPAITKTYTYYPKTDELKSVTYSGGLVSTPNVTYTYHRSGDVKSVTEVGASAREFHYDFDSTRSHTDLQWLSEDLPDYYTGLSSVATATNSYTGFKHDRLLNTYQSTGLKGRLAGFKLGVGNTTDDTALTTDQYASAYDYDATGRFNRLTPAATNTWTYGYTPNTNLLSGRTLASSTIATGRRYEPDRNLLTSIETRSAPTTSVAKYAYRYNKLGNREDVIQTGSQFDLYGAGLGIDYAYNDRQEVTGYDSFIAGSSTDLDGNPHRVPGRSHAFVYDDMGNRKSHIHVGLPGGDVSHAWQANALNQLSGRTNPDFVLVQGTAPLEAWVTAGFTATADLTRAQRANQFFNAAHELRDSSTSTAAVHRSDLDLYSVLPDGWLDTDGTTVLGDQIDKETRTVWLPPATETFTYDVRGNLKSDGRWDYTRDAENRLVFIQTTATAITAGAPEQKYGYRYDYSGRRYAKDVYAWNSTDAAYETQPSKTTLYYYDGWNLVYEARYSGITYETDGDPKAATFDGETAYYWGLDWSTTLDGAGGVGGLVAIATRQAGATAATFRYPGYDGNGNLVTLLDATGNVTASYEYGPYGEALRADGADAALNPFRFSTKYHDAETGLYYYGHRYYSSDYGRFLSQDPIGESGGINLYAFVNNNPFNLWDYLGLYEDRVSLYYPGFLENSAGIPYSFASDRKSSRGSVTISIQEIDMSPFFPSSESFRARTLSINLGPSQFDLSALSNIDVDSSAESIDDLYGVEDFDSSEYAVPSTWRPRMRLSDAKSLDDIDRYLGLSESDLKLAEDHYHNQQARRMMREAMPQFMMHLGGSVGGGVGARSMTSSSSSLKSVKNNIRSAKIEANPVKPKVIATKFNIKSILKNPQSLWGKTADEIVSLFKDAGYKVSVRQSTRGSQRSQIISIEGHPEIAQIQLHPGGGRHAGSYIKISTSTQGKVKVVDPSTYQPIAGDKAVIIPAN